MSTSCMMHARTLALILKTFIASPAIKAFKNATWSITISKIYLGITVFYSLVREKLLSLRRGDFND